MGDSLRHGAGIALLALGIVGSVTLVAAADSANATAAAAAPAAATPPAAAAAPVPAAPASSAPLPVLADAGRIACSGTFDGNPFWACLLPRDPAFGNHRVLQVVYTPPAAADLGGFVLSDCPFVLLDGHAAVVAWNGRESESQVLPGVSGYKITREIANSATTAAVASDRRAIPGARGFDLHLAPLQLAFAWRPGQTAHVRVVDLFGPRGAEAMAADWDGAHGAIAGAVVTIEADGDGRLHRLLGADGREILVVTRWTIGAADAASAPATGASTATRPAAAALP